MIKKIYKHLFKKEVKEIEDYIGQELMWGSIDIILENMKLQLNKMTYIDGNTKRERIDNLKKDKSIYLKFLRYQEELELILELDKDYYKCEK